MFVYFIVTDTGRTILKYPVNANQLSFGALGSHKVLMNIDIYVTNSDNALDTTQLRNLLLNMFSTIAPIKNNSDISVCYFAIPEGFSHYSSVLLALLRFLFLPYPTYNRHVTFCLRDGMTDNLPQAFSNILLWWLCVAISATLPLVLYFIPHSVEGDTKTYRQHDVPFSITMLMSYIEYWKPQSDCRRNEKFCLFLQERVISNPVLRGYIFVASISLLVGHIIKAMIHMKQALENELLIAMNTIFLRYFSVIESIFVVYLICFVIVFAVKMWTFNLLIDNAKFHIFVVGKPDQTRDEQDNRFQCIDINDLDMPLKKTGPLLSSKRVSETLLSYTFWANVWKRSKILFPLNFIIVIISWIPIVNEIITVIHLAKNKKGLRTKICTLARYLTWIVCRVMIINIMFMQTATLISQVIILSLFVSIPIYPKRLAYIVLIIGIFKFILQTVMQFQKKAQRVLTYTFKELEEQGHPKSELPKKDFSNVLKHCPSVNECGVLMKLIAFSFVSSTAYTAINHGDQAAMVWNDIIPPIIILIGPDWLYTFLYNEAADDEYIKQCVKDQVAEMIQNKNLNTLNNDEEREMTTITDRKEMNDAASEV